MRNLLGRSVALLVSPRGSFDLIWQISIISWHFHEYKYPLGFCAMFLEIARGAIYKQILRCAIDLGKCMAIDRSLTPWYTSHPAILICQCLSLPWRAFKMILEGVRHFIVRWPMQQGNCSKFIDIFCFQSINQSTNQPINQPTSFGLFWKFSDWLKTANIDKFHFNCV